MNADRLLQFAKDFIEEYDQFNVRGLVQETSNLCSNRPQSNSHQFNVSSETFRERARQIIQNTRFDAYPRSYLDTVRKSPYVKFLPSRVSEIIIAGLTGDVTTTMSANECTAFLSAANTAYSELSALKTTLEKLGLSPISIEAEKLSIEFSLPRISFDNVALDYLNWNEHVDSIISAYHEYLGVADEKPRLVFTSTTDPIVGYTAYIAAAYSITKLINGLLTIGKNAIELYGAIKRLKESNIATSASLMEADAERITKRDVEKIVEETLEQLRTSLEDGRKNEIRNRIVINAVLLVPIIIDGASISISPESLAQLQEVKLDLVSGDNPEFLKLIAENRSKEDDLLTAVRLSGGQNLMRLTQQKPQEDE